jgi:hypothetical protein
MTERVLGGFEQERGEVMRPGDRALGLPLPLPANIPVKPAPPYPRQVISGYDARPIGGYDFVQTGLLIPYANPLLTVRSPLGFITVLRRIELEAMPATMLSEPWAWRLVIDSITQPNWEWGHGPVLDASRALDTFVVIPPDTPYGLRVLNDFSTLPGITIVARFIGNLLLDSNIPPTEQVGSMPTRVSVQSEEGA